MERLDYLVIYQSGIYKDNRTEIPISIILRKEADAKEKLSAIKFHIKQKKGIDDFNIIGIFKL